MEPRPHKTHLPSVAQLIISVAGLVTSFGSVILYFLLIFAFRSIPDIPMEMDQSIPASFWFFLIISLVAIPSLILSFKRLARWHIRSESKPRSWLLITSILLVLLIIGLLLINRFSQILNNPLINLVLSLLAIIIPLLWFVEIGRFRLYSGNPQRRWGMVNFAIFVGLPIIILIEFLLLIFVAVIGFSQFDYKPLLMTIQTQLMLNPNDFSPVINQLSSLAKDPKNWVIGFLFIALLVPILEEICKPLALWFFAKRGWSPSEGFSAGLILGASFALVESVTALGSVSSEAWISTLVGRFGTGLLHTLTAGLTGWALVSTWKDGRYLRVGFAYVISVLLHGCWNFFALIYGLGTIDIFSAPAFSGLVPVAPWVLGGLCGIMLVLLFLMNHIVWVKSKPPFLPPALPPVFPSMPPEIPAISNEMMK